MVDKEQKLEKSLAAMAVREEAYEKACLEAAEAESTYRIESAKQFKLSDGSNADARRSDATVAVAELLKHRDHTAAVRDFTKEKLKDAQIAVSARQSILYADVRTNKLL